MTTPPALRTLDQAASRELYENMSTRELLGLQTAFQLDRAAATKPAALDFIDGRLALIAEILQERSVNAEENR